MKLLVLTVCFTLYVTQVTCNMFYECKSQPSELSETKPGDEIHFNCQANTDIEDFSLESCTWEHNGEICKFDSKDTNQNCNQNWQFYQSKEDCGLIIANSDLVSDFGPWRVTMNFNWEGFGLESFVNFNIGAIQSD